MEPEVERWTRRGLNLARFTVAYNVVEGVVAVSAGAAAGLVSLVGAGMQGERLKLTGRNEPVFVCFFLTNRCNLRCTYCFVVDEKIDRRTLSAEFTREEAFRFVDEFYALGTRMMFLLGGEPLLHKHIGEILRKYQLTKHFENFLWLTQFFIFQVLSRFH